MNRIEESIMLPTSPPPYDSNNEETEEVDYSFLSENESFHCSYNNDDNNNDPESFSYYEYYNDSTENETTYKGIKFQTIIQNIKLIFTSTKRLFFTIILMFGIFWLSIICYSILYYFINMPWSRYAIREPIYFDYNYPGGIGFGNGADAQCVIGNETTIYYDNNSFSSSNKCSSSSISSSSNNSVPSAKINFYSESTQWKSYIYPKEEHQELFTNTQKQDTRLQPGTKYYIDISFHLPESDINKDIGVFMVHVYLYSYGDTLVASSKRSTMLPYESWLMFLIRRIFYMVLFLLDFVTESSDVLVPSFDNFRERKDNPLSYAYIELITPPYSNIPIQIQSAEIRIGKERNIIQTIFYERFYLCSFVGVFFFYIIFSSLFFSLKLLIKMLNLNLQKRRRKQQRRQEAAQNNDDISEEMDINNNNDDIRSINCSSQWNDSKEEFHSTCDSSITSIQPNKTDTCTKNDDDSWESFHPQQNIKQTKKHIQPKQTNNNHKIHSKSFYKMKNNSQYCYSSSSIMNNEIIISRKKRKR